MSHTRSGPRGSRLVDCGPGKPRKQISYDTGFWSVPPKESHIPGHLQRDRHLEGRKNPYHPSAMPISRVQPGVPFVCYDAHTKLVWARGIFKSFPTTTPLRPHETGYNHHGLWVHAQLDNGQAVMIPLASMGIIKTEYGYYARHVTVSPKREHLLEIRSDVIEDEIQRIRGWHVKLTAQQRW